MKLPSVVLHLDKFTYGPVTHPHNPTIQMDFLFWEGIARITFTPSPYVSMDYEELCKKKNWDSPRIYQATGIHFVRKEDETPKLT